MELYFTATTTTTTTNCYCDEY